MLQREQIKKLQGEVVVKNERIQLLIAEQTAEKLQKYVMKSLI